MRQERLELSRDCSHHPLKVARLPFRHCRSLTSIIYCLLRACFRFSLIEPLFSPYLILRQESLSNSVLFYMKCWLDVPFTPLWREWDSNPHPLRDPLLRRARLPITPSRQNKVKSSKITAAEVADSNSLCIFCQITRAYNTAAKFTFVGVAGFEPACNQLHFQLLIRER